MAGYACVQLLKPSYLGDLVCFLLLTRKRKPNHLFNMDELDYMHCDVVSDKETIIDDNYCPKEFIKNVSLHALPLPVTQSEKQPTMELAIQTTVMQTPNPSEESTVNTLNENENESDAEKVTTTDVIIQPGLSYDLPRKQLTSSNTSASVILPLEIACNNEVDKQQHMVCCDENNSMKNSVAKSLLIEIVDRAVTLVMTKKLEARHSWHTSETAKEEIILPIT